VAGLVLSKPPTASSQQPAPACSKRKDDTSCKGGMFKKRPSPNCRWAPTKIPKPPPACNPSLYASLCASLCATQACVHPKPVCTPSLWASLCATQACVHPKPVCIPVCTPSRCASQCAPAFAVVTTAGRGCLMHHTAIPWPACLVWRVHSIWPSPLAYCHPGACLSGTDVCTAYGQARLHTAWVQLHAGHNCGHASHACWAGRPCTLAKGWWQALRSKLNCSIWNRYKLANGPIRNR